MTLWDQTRDLYPGPVVDRVERIARFFRVGRLELEPFQRLIVAESLLTPETAVALPRGNGKTTLFGGVGMAVMHDEPGSLVVAAASKRDQAKILFDGAVQMAELPLLSKEFHATINELRHRNGSRLMPVAADMGGRGHGLTPRLALVDELHGHVNRATYVAQKTSQLKNPDMRLTTISTMGMSRSGPWWEIDQQALALPIVFQDDWFTLRRSPSGGFGSLRWALPEDIDPESVTGKELKRVNPASWITEEQLQEQLDSPALPRHEALAYHGNLWPQMQTSWLPAGAWANIMDVEAKIPPGAPVVVGVDRGTQSDATAIVALWTRPDGRVVVGATMLDSPSLLDDVLNAIRGLAGGLRVLGVGYDPWQMQDAADILEREGLRTFAHSMATAPRARSSQELYEAIVSQTLMHDGDQALALHLSNSVGRGVREGFVIDKTADGAPMDLIVALMIANHLRLELIANPTESVYARKELLIL